MANEPEQAVHGDGSRSSSWQLVLRLLGISWRYRWDCLIVLCLQAGLMLLAIGGVLLTGVAIDLVRYHLGNDSAPPILPFPLALSADRSPYEQVAWVAAGVILLATLRTVGNYANAVASGRLVHEKIVVDLRSDVYRKLQQLSFRFYDANATGSIINRVTGDVQAVRSLVDAVLLQVIVLLISLVVYLIFMLRVHVLLTIACLATTPLMWILTTMFSRSVRPLYDENRRLVDRLLLILSENAQGVHVVKGFGLQAAESDKFQRANREVRDQQRSIFGRVSLFSPSVQFLTQVNLAILLGYGGYLVSAGELPLGTGLVVFAGLLQQFSSQVGNLTALANSVQQSLAGARRVFEVLDAPLEVTTPADAAPIKRARGAIEFERVTFGYEPGQPVLQELDLRIEAGERIGVLGATGAGKSSLLALVARFFDPQSGRITLDGRDLRGIQLESLRRQTGLVFQESFLFSNSIAANIAFGRPAASRKEIERAARWAAAEEFIAELPDGYGTVLGEFGMSLSGGQRQRLALARALLLDPAILLLDDPTAAVDSGTEKAILAALQGATSGRTTLLVSNRISALWQMDRIVVLRSGRVVQIGTHDELIIREGLYRQVAQAQGMSQRVEPLRERAS